MPIGSCDFGPGGVNRTYSFAEEAGDTIEEMDEVLAELAEEITHKKDEIKRLTHKVFEMRKGGAQGKLETEERLQSLPDQIAAIQEQMAEARAVRQRAERVRAKHACEARTCVRELHNSELMPHSPSQTGSALRSFTCRFHSAFAPNSFRLDSSRFLSFCLCSIFESLSRLMRTGFALGLV